MALLTPFGEEIWIADGPAAVVAGFHYPARMAVIRLKDGLFIWSPITLTEPLRSEVEALGQVRHIAAPRIFAADFEHDDQGRLRLKGRLRQDESGPYWFRLVEGTMPKGDRTLVVWRKLTGDSERDNLALEVWMTEKLKINTRDFEFDLIYVNGDNNLENLKRADDTWKVRLIEEDFHRLMFDVEDV